MRVQLVVEVDHVHELDVGEVHLHRCKGYVRHTALGHSLDGSELFPNGVKKAGNAGELEFFVVNQKAKGGDGFSAKCFFFWSRALIIAAFSGEK